MRILAFKRTLPWPIWSGQNLRTYHVLRRLSRRHEVLLACWEGDPAHLAHMPFDTLLRCLPEETGNGGDGLTPKYLSQHYGLHPASVPWLDQFIRELSPDVLFGVDYQTLLALDAHRDVPSACYMGDNRWLQDLERLRREKANRWSNLKSVLWSFVLHRRYASAANAYIFVAERDAFALKRFTDRWCVGVPNGVDTEHFKPSPEPRRPHSVVFVGSLNFPPNVEAVCWFSSQVWPAVRKRIPQAQLTLVGKKAVPEVLAWDGQRGIEVVGQVADVRPYLDSAAVEVVPMRSGGGIKNKILEGWAMGVPIVATTMSLHSLSARQGQNILVADTADDFAGTVAGVLNNAELQQQLGHSGRETAVQDHTWDRTAEHIEQCLLQVLENRLEVSACP